MTEETVKIDTPDSRATSEMLADFLVFLALEFRDAIRYARQHIRIKAIFKTFSCRFYTISRGLVPESPIPARPGRDMLE